MAKDVKRTGKKLQKAPLVAAVVTAGGAAWALLQNGEIVTDISRLGNGFIQNLNNAINMLAQEHGFSNALTQTTAFPQLLVVGGGLYIIFDRAIRGLVNRRRAKNERLQLVGENKTLEDSNQNYVLTIEALNKDKEKMQAEIETLLLQMKN